MIKLFAFLLTFALFLTGCDPVRTTSESHTHTETFLQEPECSTILDEITCNAKMECEYFEAKCHKVEDYSQIIYNRSTKITALKTAYTTKRALLASQNKTELKAAQTYFEQQKTIIKNDAELKSPGFLADLKAQMDNKDLDAIIAEFKQAFDAIIKPQGNPVTRKTPAQMAKDANVSTKELRTSVDRLTSEEKTKLFDNKDFVASLFVRPADENISEIIAQIIKVKPKNEILDTQEKVATYLTGYKSGTNQQNAIAELIVDNDVINKDMLEKASKLSEAGTIYKGGFKFALFTGNYRLRDKIENDSLGTIEAVLDELNINSTMAQVLLDAETRAALINKATGDDKAFGIFQKLFNNAPNDYFSNAQTKNELSNNVKMLLTKKEQNDEIKKIINLMVTKADFADYNDFFKKNSKQADNFIKANENDPEILKKIAQTFLANTNSALRANWFLKSLSENTWQLVAKLYNTLDDGKKLDFRTNYLNIALASSKWYEDSNMIEQVYKVVNDLNALYTFQDRKDNTYKTGNFVTAIGMRSIGFNQANKKYFKLATYDTTLTELEKIVGNTHWDAAYAELADLVKDDEQKLIKEELENKIFKYNDFSEEAITAYLNVAPSSDELIKRDILTQMLDMNATSDALYSIIFYANTDDESKMATDMEVKNKLTAALVSVAQKTPLSAYKDVINELISKGADIDAITDSNLKTQINDLKD